MKNFLEIRTIEDEIVYYVRKYGSYHISAMQAYMELREFIIRHNLETPNINKNIKIYGIPHDNPCITPTLNCKYDYCITLSKHAPIEGNVSIQTLRGGKYAVFAHKGPYETIGSLFFAIESQWVPENKYIRRDLPAFIVHLKDVETTAPEDLLSEIYIPIE